MQSLVAMRDELDISISTTFCNTEELITLDPIRGQTTIKEVIGRISDGLVTIHAINRDLNVFPDIMIIRDRLIRYEVRKYFGPNAAPWNAGRDELTDSISTVNTEPLSREHANNLPSPRRDLAESSGQVEISHPTLIQSDPNNGIITVSPRTGIDNSASEGLSRPLVPSRINIINGTNTRNRTELSLHSTLRDNDNNNRDITSVRDNCLSYRRNPTVIYTNDHVNDRHPRLDETPRELQVLSINRNDSPSRVSNFQPVNVRGAGPPPPEQSNIPNNSECVSRQTTHCESRRIRFEQRQDLNTGVERGNSIENQYRNEYLGSLFQPQPLPRDTGIQGNLPSHPPYERQYSREPLASTRLLENPNDETSPHNEPMTCSETYRPVAENCRPQVTEYRDPTPHFNRENSNDSRHASSSRICNDRSTDSTRWENSTFLRESRTCDLLHKWNISFKGHEKNDREEFLTHLTVCKDNFGLSLEDLLRTIPAVFDAQTSQWFNREYRAWEKYDDFIEAFRLQYGADDLQKRLRQELEHRTQGPREDICTYLSKFRALLDRIRPLLPISKQLDRTYRNLHPSYRQRISRDQFNSFLELQKLGKREEVRRLQDRAYKPQPPSDETWFPKSAYEEPPTKPRRTITGAAGVAQHGANDNTCPSIENLTQIAPVRNPTTPKTTCSSQQRPLSSTPNKNRGNATSRPTKSNLDTPNSNPRPNPNSPVLPNPPIFDHSTLPTSSPNIEQRKQTEPYFACGQVGHWRDECPRSVCRVCGRKGVTERRYPTCSPRHSPGNAQSESR